MFAEVMKRLMLPLLFVHLSDMHFWRIKKLNAQISRIYELQNYR